MIFVMFITKQKIVKAKKKLDAVHLIFKKPSEQEAVIDFANCLKKHLKNGTAKDFLKSCDSAADDIADGTKVPEPYDSYTVGVMRDMADIFAREIFGKNFAKEVRQFMDIRKFV